MLRQVALSNAWKQEKKSFFSFEEVFFQLALTNFFSCGDEMIGRLLTCVVLREKKEGTTHFDLKISLVRVMQRLCCFFSSFFNFNFSLHFRDFFWFLHRHR